jgi:hypothetical protein
MLCSHDLTNVERSLVDLEHAKAVCAGQHDGYTRILSMAILRLQLSCAKVITGTYEVCM